MLKLIAVVVVLEGKLDLSVLSFEFKVDQQISGALVDPILYSKDVLSMYCYKTSIGSFQIFDVIKGTLAANPIVDFNLYVSNMLIKDPVEILKDWDIVVMIEVCVNLAGLLLL